MHAGLLIAFWMAGVATLQFVPPTWLFVSVVVGVLIALRFVKERSFRLLRRTRFLMLAVAIFFAWFSPGESLWPALPGLSPTREGLALAAEHLGRLVGVVLCVAGLLEHLSVPRLVGGLYALFHPFERIGLPADRLAVRLMLVLSYVEATPSGGWRSWLEDDIVPVHHKDATPISIVREPLGYGQLTIAVLVGLTLLALLELRA
ncbi:MAG TPA: CbiQ family ECF transporter T component [Aromatoleum sp.]|uniref:CbiQ family ECF transporter T component n=1 Tax=Aromatoleum sp. TaxID=2307007 RepID=UPI002B49053F|nr:CbiQ family ECF transporter T component [Aromatoleum sp.]HJV27629.1 CbiQ family ECF transporter T component [Aromatoleum sp.]